MIWVDSTAPTVTLPVYTNATQYTNSQDLIFNISVTDSGVGASYCEINVGGNTNQTVAVSDGWCNGTYSLSGIGDGNQTIYAYANDTLGNINLNDSYVIWVDSTAPYFTTLANQTTYIGQDFSYDIDATDDGVGISIYALNDTTNFTINSGTGAVTNASPLEGVYIEVLNVTVNDTLGNLNWSIWTIDVQEEADITSPYFTSIPANASLFYGNETLGVDFDATDVVEFDTFFINWTTYFTINSTGWLSNTSAIPVGTYEINVSINDTSGNTNETSYRVTINQNPSSCGVFLNDTSLTYGDAVSIQTNCTSAYTLYLNSSEISNNSVHVLGAGLWNASVFRTDTANYSEIYNEYAFTVSQGTLTLNLGAINVTASDPNLDKIIIRLYNSAHAQINSSTTSSSPNFINFTNLNDGVYFYNATANDTFGNDDSLETKNITLDITLPQVNIIYPQATNYTTNVSQLNYTFTETNPDKCWWSNNSGGWNSSAQTCGTNWTGLISNEGSNTWTIYMNDTAGNENSTSVTFNKDTAYPAVAINSPLNQTYDTDSITFNVTATDGGGISLCWYSLNSGGTNYSMTQSGNYWHDTNASMNQGSHTVIFYCNDSSGNLNDSKQETFFNCLFLNFI